MNTGEFLAVYERALASYKQGDCDDAWQIITDFEQQHSMKTLLGYLLKAYILRTRKQYVSEVSLLNDLVRDFADSEDKKRLADAYSLLGAAYRMLGQSEAAVAAFVRSAQLEPSTGRKLTEISNALFAANAIEDLPAAKMQALYAAYRHDLQEMAVLGLLIAIFATLGDLVESVAKRYVGIKDSGNIIPGHGGVWDRFDSVLFTAPLVFYFVQFVNLLGK